MIDSIYDVNDQGPLRAGFSLGRARGRPFKGGGGGDTTNISKTEPPEEVKPYLAPFLQQASQVAQTPYQSYSGQQIAGFTPDQLAGFGMARDTANQSQGSLSNATGQLNSTINGQYMGYSPGANAYMGQTANVGQNALLGMNNPYLQNAIDASQGDVVKQFNNSVANNTDATMARSGAFGGSAWQQAQSENANQLAQNLGRVSNDMRMQDYGLQAQLGESDLNRRLQAQQTDLARNSALSQAGLEMNNSNFQNERARQLQAAGMIPGMAQAGYANSQALLGIGDAQQALDQGGLDVSYQNWLNQQNAPYQSLDVMGNAIRSTMGAGGTTTQTGPNPYQRNSTAGALGGALSGAAAGSMFGPWGTAIGGGLGLLGGLL